MQHGLSRRLVRVFGALVRALLLERLTGLLGHSLPRRFISHCCPAHFGGLVGPDLPTLRAVPAHVRRSAGVISASPTSGIARSAWVGRRDRPLLSTRPQSRPGATIFEPAIRYRRATTSTRRRPSVGRAASPIHFAGSSRLPRPRLRKPAAGFLMPSMNGNALNSSLSFTPRRPEVLRSGTVGVTSDVARSM